MVYEGNVFSRKYFQEILLIFHCLVETLKIISKTLGRMTGQATLRGGWLGFFVGVMVIIWEEGWDGVGGMATKSRMGVVLGEEQLRSSTRVGGAAVRGRRGEWETSFRK
jgi:hypothetical protein